jgi:tRNA isopentenyl-2-thiomethyl-A-37 hydroxylase MiaE
MIFVTSGFNARSSKRFSPAFPRLSHHIQKYRKGLSRSLAEYTLAQAWSRESNLSQRDGITSFDKESRSMTLEEAEKQVTHEQSTAFNKVDGDW